MIEASLKISVYQSLQKQHSWLQKPEGQVKKPDLSYFLFLVYNFWTIEKNKIIPQSYLFFGGMCVKTPAICECEEMWQSERKQEKNILSFLSCVKASENILLSIRHFQEKKCVKLKSRKKNWPTYTLLLFCMCVT